jgi:hypothetical protein
MSKWEKKLKKNKKHQFIVVMAIPKAKNKKQKQ